MKNKLAAITSVILTAALITGCNSFDYKEAQSLYESGDYQGAKAIFAELGDYKDSADMVNKCHEVQTFDFNYSESKVIKSNTLSKYEKITWTSNDESIATVSESGVIIGVAPGTAIISATDEKDELIGEYTVNINIVPITNIVLSTNNATITEGELLALSYLLYPENASDYGIKWASADESVAIVNERGEILAQAPGQTTISASNSDGVIATCSVTVEQKPAYDRLKDSERLFVSTVLKYLYQFKNPDSVTIKKVNKRYTGNWEVEISAMNGFGGFNSKGYYLTDDVGFWNWESFGSDIDITVESSDEFDIDLINEAINEKR